MGQNQALCSSVPALSCDLPGLTFSADAEVVDRLWSGQSVAVHIVHLDAVITDTRDEGLRHS